MVVTGAYPPTPRTARQAPGRFHREDDTDLFEVDSGDEKTGDPYQNSGKLGDGHVFLHAFGVLVDTKKHGKRALFNLLCAECQKLRRGQAQAAGKGSQLPTLDAGEPKEGGYFKECHRPFVETPCRLQNYAASMPTVH